MSKQVVMDLEDYERLLDIIDNQHKEIINHIDNCDYFKEKSKQYKFEIRDEINLLLKEILPILKELNGKYIFDEIEHKSKGKVFTPVDNNPLNYDKTIRKILKGIDKTCDGIC